MSIDVKRTGVTAEGMAGLDEACRWAVSGIRDPEVMRQACERIDRMREEIRRNRGVIDDETFQNLLSDDDLS